MKPTRSAKSTETRRRSVGRLGAPRGGGGAGRRRSAASGVPHSPQKRSSAVSGAPQDGQAAASEEPQLRQKRFPEGFSVPHEAQSTPRVYWDGRGTAMANR